MTARANKAESEGYSNPLSHFAVLLLACGGTARKAQMATAFAVSGARYASHPIGAMLNYAYGAKWRRRVRQGRRDYKQFCQDRCQAQK
jgi:hypothetical protein